MSTTEVSHCIPPPDLDLPVRDVLPALALLTYSRFCFVSQYPDSPGEVTANLLKLTELAPNPYVHV
jgi:hypothetical protein